MRCFSTVGLASAIVMVSLAVDASAADDVDVLDNLETYDSVFDSGFTVSSKRYNTDNLVRGVLDINVTRRWRLCFEGDRVGYVMEVLDYDKPAYVQLKGVAPGEPFSLSVRTKQWGYWGHDVSGNHYEDTVLSITAQGEVTETGKLHNSSVFGPRDSSPIVPKWVALWSLGRFFSKHLTQVTKVEKAPDGMLLVTANGRKVDQVLGRWELEIEPDAAWMVRKAKFFRAKTPDVIDAEMQNQGTIWSGPHCIPKTGEINYWGPLGEGREGTERLEFEPRIEEFDEDLYAESQHAVVDNRTPALTLHDYRVSPPAISEPFRPTPVAKPPLQAAPHIGFKMWLYLIHLAAAFVLLVYFLSRRIWPGAKGEAEE